MKKESFVLGTGYDQSLERYKVVLSGNYVFKLMDTYGMPFDIVQMILDETNHAFDIFGFVKAAKESKNYSKVKIVRILTEDISEKYEPVKFNKVMEVINFFYQD